MKTTKTTTGCLNLWDEQTTDQLLVIKQQLLDSLGSVQPEAATSLWGQVAVLQSILDAREGAASTAHAEVPTPALIPAPATNKATALHMQVVTPLPMNAKGLARGVTRATLCGRSGRSKMTSVEAHVTCTACLARLTPAVPQPHEEQGDEALLASLRTHTALREAMDTLAGHLLIEDGAAVPVVPAKEVPLGAAQPTETVKIISKTVRVRKITKAQPVEPATGMPEPPVSYHELPEPDARVIEMTTDPANRAAYHAQLLSEEEDGTRLVSLFTTAPREYDEPGTVLVQDAVGMHKGQVVREVRTPLRRLSGQRNNYTTGRFETLTPSEWAQVFVGPLAQATALLDVFDTQPLAQALETLKAQDAAQTQPRRAHRAPAPARQAQTKAPRTERPSKPCSQGCGTIIYGATVSMCATCWKAMSKEQQAAFTAAQKAAKASQVAA